MKQLTACPLLLLIFCAGLLVIPATAADITMTAAGTDYYFGFGESADVPVAITSTFDHDIDGTLQFTTTEQLQNTGTVMMSTKNKVYTNTVSPGASQIILNAGTSDVAKTVKVQVAYDYTGTSPVHVALPEILIHFVEKPQQSGSSQSPVTSTSSAGTGNVPSSSSVQIVQQSVSAQQQAGRDGTSSPQQSLQNNQMSQDANALKEQLQKEAEKKETEKAAFEEALSRDPLLASVNESMAADGFVRSSQATNPESGTAGTFSQEYRNAAGETATVAGKMENGAVPSVTETSAAPVNVTAPLAANTSYQTSAGKFSEQGFSRNTSTLIRSADGGATVNLTYQDPQGKRAFINATTDGKNVTQLTVAVEPDAPFDYVPVLAAIGIVVVVAIAAWILYRRFRRPGAPNLRMVPPSAPREPFDHRKAARELLKQAEIAYGRQQYPDACGLAGQALRLFLSGENGAYREMTNMELLAFLRSINADTGTVRELLDRCSDVEFARGTLGADEFPRMAAAIRSLIDGKQ